MGEQLGVRRALAGGVAAVELVVGGVEIARVEHHERTQSATGIVLDDREVLDREVAAVADLAREPHPEEREPLTARGQQARCAIGSTRMSNSIRRSVKKSSPRRSQADEGTAVLASRSVGANDVDHAVPVALAPAALAHGMSRATALANRAGGDTGRELVEARERLVVAVEVELLHVREAAVGPEGPEHEEAPLEGAAAGALGAEVRPADEERVRTKAEDVVDAGGDLVGGVEQRADPAPERSAPRATPRPTVRWSTNSTSGAMMAAIASARRGSTKAATERAVAAARSRAGPSGERSA